MALVASPPTGASELVLHRRLKDIVANASPTRKRRAAAVGLHAFANPGFPVDLRGAFRDNVRVFLRECCDAEGYAVSGGMPVWRTLLVDESTGVVVPLYTVEEAVRHSSRPFCEYCRCSGWSHHFVSKRRYHFIIPLDEHWDQPLNQDCFDIHTHLLHGLIHCNGFGHLLVINGREGGSKHISGREIMDLWDRICTFLRTREITVEDVSQKKSMDLRLLLGVAYDCTWFGRWGYRYHLGSFCVTEKMYKEALRSLALRDLYHLIRELEPTGRDRELRRIIYTYLKRCDNLRHATVRDLLRELLHPMTLLMASTETTPPRQHVQRPLLKPPCFHSKRSSSGRKRCRDFEEVMSELDSRWSARRLLGAAKVVVQTLEENGRTLTRQEVRDAARVVIGDTGLLDFVLKSLGDCIVDGVIVRRTQNPYTRVLEFSVEGNSASASSSSSSSGRGETEEAPPPPIAEDRELMLLPSVAVRTRPRPGQVERDITWVYKHVLLRGSEGEKILNGKRWVKSWPLRDEEDDKLRYLCRWMPGDDDLLRGDLTRKLPPPDVLVLPPHASVADLRKEAERALRDTYCIMEGFVATRVDGVVGEEWDPLFGAAESGATVWVRGLGVDMSVTAPGEGQLLRYEGGAESWTVECGCGTRDDDGERMVACDLCESWQHTRCAGIDDGHPVPKLFLCAKCAGVVVTTDDVGWMEMCS